jgi:hypothetical protein
MEMSSKLLYERLTTGSGAVGSGTQGLLGGGLESERLIYHRSAHTENHGVSQTYLTRNTKRNRILMGSESIKERNKNMVTVCNSDIRR